MPVGFPGMGGPRSRGGWLSAVSPSLTPPSSALWVKGAVGTDKAHMVGCPVIPTSSGVVAADRPDFAVKSPTLSLLKV
jgi:hypothetical protein